MTAADQIRSERLLALLRGVERPDEVVSILVTAGVGVVELTLDTPGAPAAIERLRTRGDVNVVAGTVRTPEDVIVAVAAEACVSPGFSAAGAAAVGISFGPGTTEAQARRAVEAVASAAPAGERREEP